MAEKKHIYITTTLPYVNAEPHIGHAMEFIRADVIARYKRAEGYEVFFNTGTDEHGQKIYEGAEKEGVTPKEYTDKYSSRFREFLKLANISNDGFLRTTEERHIAAAQKTWQTCLDKGDIYKAKQTIHYCVGCEMEKTTGELVDGRCPQHPNRELETREEENYFFKFSKYQDALLALYDRGLVTPESKQNEIRQFVKGGLHDFSVSRLRSKMPWGVPVPGDEEHVMYVWFDALNSYISTLGYGSGDESKFLDYWQNGTVVQYCGKDNNKAQSAIWQAMLLSSGIKNTNTIVINGHIISNGQKMSKSIGNVINPFDIINTYAPYSEYPEEVLRFVMCHEVSTFEDSDITDKSISDAYTAYLQNGIGNQVNRILKLSSVHLSPQDIDAVVARAESGTMDTEYKTFLDEFKINEAIHLVTSKIKSLDEYIQSTAPFSLVKDPATLEQGKDIIRESLFRLADIGHHLYFFMPRASMAIYESIRNNTMPDKPMFNRVQ